MNDGRAIANLILDLAAENGQEVTNLGLQKILFFCHGWTIAKLGEPLIKQDFEAWQYGPVLAHVYREFKSFDRAPITLRARRLDPSTGHHVVAHSELSSEVVDVVRDAVKFYSKLRPGTLVELSHASDGPWASVWNHDGQTNPGMRIENSAIESYFRKLTAPF